MGNDIHVYLAFRFHVNLYHSYRGDTEDERGFGKDIRIIRNTVDVLDAANADGIPVRATWDIENYYSLQRIMPDHCPDIIKRLQNRVRRGLDEINLMSFNNGIVTAHTASELDMTLSRAWHNDSGSGLSDLFGRVYPLVRPQEMMYTPAHVKHYRRHGIEAVSLFYSAIPFNAFSAFVAPLSFMSKFNPVWLTYPGMEERMVMVPAYNHGDIGDNITLRAWIRRIRARQTSHASPKDVLLLIDADADDSFWWGYRGPILPRLISTAQGIGGLIQSVSTLPYLRFTTPGNYLDGHAPVDTVVLRQDTADGSFDGYASWAEKWSNHALWSGIERSRLHEYRARRLMGRMRPEEMKRAQSLLAESAETRLLALSTTHFGLSTPVMNADRLSTGAQLVASAERAASSAYRLAATALRGHGDSSDGNRRLTLVNYVRGVSTQSLTYPARESTGIIRLRPGNEQPPVHVILDPDGREIPFATIPAADRRRGAYELLIRFRLSGEERRELQMQPPHRRDRRAGTAGTAFADDHRVGNSHVELRFDEAGRPGAFYADGVPVGEGNCMRTAVRYHRKLRNARSWHETEVFTDPGGLCALKRFHTEIPVGRAGDCVSIEREYLVVDSLPYLYVTTRIAYPETLPRGGRARAYDERWKEVMPCEIRPSLAAADDRPFRIWKHNYLDHVTSYDLDYYRYSRNRSLDSINNHITCSWVAVSDQRRGVLVAQSGLHTTSFAFCPMRLRISGDRHSIRLNPFGTYTGKQYRYPTSFTGIGRLAALAVGDHLRSSAPSYAGHDEEFSLLLAPYPGDAPPEAIQADAEAFTYPPIAHLDGEPGEMS